MKLGKSLTELAQEVERQANEKKDFVAGTQALKAEVVEKKLVLTGLPTLPQAQLNKNAHAQMATALAIPKPYYDRMLTDSPELLATNINHWFANEPQKRMIRTLDGQVRAVLSERYRTLDNFDLMQAILPVLIGMKVDFKSCEVTESRLYLKVIFPEMRTVVPGSPVVNDVVEAGIVISNSEVGHSSLRVEPFFHRLVCTNGMISNYAQRKYHVGKSHDVIDVAYEIMRDETKEAADKAFWMKLQDVVRTAITKDVVEAQVKRFAEATQVPLVGEPVKIIENVRKTFNLSEGQATGVLTNLLKDGDMSKWGLANAITRTAQDQDSYDDATELERLGGKVVELAQKDWTALLKVA